VGWCQERLAPLEGFIVGVTADQRSEEQAELLRRRGASVVFAPALRKVALVDTDTVAATRALIADPPDYLVATTGFGTRMWFSVAQAAGLDADLRTALADTRIVARGPKSRGILHQLELPPWRSEPTEQIAGAVQHLLSLGVESKTIAVQLYGTCVPPAVAELQDHGARIVPIPVYRWDGPADDGPLAGLVRDVVQRRVSAVTFTSAPAVTEFFAVAETLALSDRVRNAFIDVVPAAVGPRTAGFLRAHGVDEPCFPSPGRLGLMVKVLSERLRAEHQHLSAGEGREVVTQGSCLVDRTAKVELTRREQQVFRILAQQPRRVAPRSLLLREVWGREPVDQSAVDTVVRRLRARVRPLGLDVRFIPRRGFALDADAAPCPSA
jgi:uroporphyrinogen-III synthase